MVDKDVENNVLIVARGMSTRLMSVGLIAQQLHWVDREPFTGTLRCTVKTRYRQTDIPCTINALDDDRIEVILTSRLPPLRRASPLSFTAKSAGWRHYRAATAADGLIIQYTTPFKSPQSGLKDEVYFI